MRIADMNWMQVEALLTRERRCVLPLGSTEQHAGLSLCTDNILAEGVALEAAEPLGVPVFPPLNYGITPYFMAYPGTISLRPETYAQLLRELLDGLAQGGFERVLIVNGHGGNSTAETAARVWQTEGTPTRRLVWHDWWKAPATMSVACAIDPSASHASWLENFPWTRLTGVDSPPGCRPPADSEAVMRLAPAEVRTLLGDGNMGGRYQRPDEDMLRIWETGVAETRARLVALGAD